MLNPIKQNNMQVLMVGKKLWQQSIILSALLTQLSVLSVVKLCHAGAFIFAGETNGVEIITHPTGYNGTGGVIKVGVCIDSTSPNAANMVTSVENIVNTWKQLTPVTPNLFLGSNNDIPSGNVDFESTALHELGHCIGLAHPNLASESGLSGADMNYTKSTNGTNNTFDIDSSLDNIIGSGDDIRGDDVNLHWFRISNNNPFTIDSTVDSSTYSLLLTDLPNDDSFAANADRFVGENLGITDTEAVMQQGAFFDEDQRSLNHDDVATIKLAMCGLDEIAGTADDYTIDLVYEGSFANPGSNPACDIILDFDNSKTSFAVCQVNGQFLSSNHVAITSGNMFFNTEFNWYFSSSSNVNETDLSITKDNGVTEVVAGQNITYTLIVNNSGPGNAINAVVEDTFSPLLTNVSWTCSASSGSNCTAGPVNNNINDTVDILNSGTLTYTINATVNSQASGQLINTAAVSSPSGMTDTVQGNNSDTDTDIIINFAIDHFLSYNVKITPKTEKFIPINSIPLVDQFENKDFNVRKLMNLYNPVDKNDEGINDTDTHLVSYLIKKVRKSCSSDAQQQFQFRTCVDDGDCGGIPEQKILCKKSPKHIKQLSLRIQNQFETIFVDTVKPQLLLLPTSKDSPPGQIPDDIDHYKCYKIKAKKNVCTGDPRIKCKVDDDCQLNGPCNKGYSKRAVHLVDQFGENKVYNLLRPTRLCTPVQKNFEPWVNPDEENGSHLMCYKVKRVKKYCNNSIPDSPRSCEKEKDCDGGIVGQTSLCQKQEIKHIPRTEIHIENQFGTLQINTKKENELCVPSIKTLSLF